MSEGRTEADNVGSLMATDEDRQLSQQASQLFENREYEKCLASLNQVLNRKSKDVKLNHNRAIAEFYKSGHRAHDTLKRILVDQYNKLYGDKAAEGLEYCCLFYNQAVILYHTKQYKSALNILEKLLPYLDPIEDTMAQKIALLLTDLYLHTYQPQRALDMIAILEKSYASSSLSDKASDKGSVEKDDGSEKSGRAGSTEPQQPDSNKSMLSQLRICSYLMLKSNKLIKKELKTLAGCSEQSTGVLFVKAQYEAFRCNHQKALRILNSHPNVTFPLGDGQMSISPGVWQLTLGMQGGSWQQSIAAVMYYNNVALTYFYQRKPNLALHYSCKALEENNRAAKDGIGKKQPDVPLFRIRGSRYYELMYNIGVQLLHTGQSQAAFDQLLLVVQVYPTNPRLWLRLAECCIMCHRQSNEDDRRIKKKMQVISAAVGSGVHRKLIIGSGVTADSSRSSGNEAAIPVATMEFASLCLDNALLLLPESAQGAGRANETTLIPSAPCTPLRQEDAENLRCCVLAAKSYVCLYHNDHVMALQCAEQLLKQPRLSGAHRYLAHLYAAEAQVALDWISAGIEHLNPDVVAADVSTTIPSQSSQSSNNGNTDKQDSPGDEPRGTTQLYPWSPSELRPAKAIVLYNLATAHAIRGEHDKALHFLAMSTQEAGQPLPAQMYHLKIYLELTEGRKKSAQNFIHDQFNHIVSSYNR